ASPPATEQQGARQDEGEEGRGQEGELAVALEHAPPLEARGGHVGEEVQEGPSRGRGHEQAEEGEERSREGDESARARAPVAQEEIDEDGGGGEERVLPREEGEPEQPEAPVASDTRRPLVAQEDEHSGEGEEEGQHVDAPEGGPGLHEP